MVLLDKKGRNVVDDLNKINFPNTIKSHPVCVCMHVVCVCMGSVCYLGCRWSKIVCVSVLLSVSSRYRSALGIWEVKVIAAALGSTTNIS